MIVAKLLAVSAFIFGTAVGYLRDYGEYYKPGDILLGVVIPVGLNCGVKSVDTRYMMVIAVFEAFQRVNEDASLVFKRYNLTLGYFILDSCGDVSRVLGFLRFVSPTDLTGLGVCSSFNDTDIDSPCKEKTGNNGVINMYSISGVVGAVFSRVTSMLSKYLQNWHIPQISGHSTTDELTDKSKNPFLLRLVASDKYQAWAIVDVLTYINVTQVAVIYTEEMYGSALFLLFQESAIRANICVVASLSLGLANQSIESLLTLDENVMHIVYLAEWSEPFLAQLSSRRYIFITSDVTSHLPRRYMNTTSLSVYVNLPTNIDSDVFKIFSNISLTQIRKYPFYREFWALKNKCCFGQSCAPDCDKIETTSSPMNDLLGSDIFLDLVSVFGRTLSRLIESRCNLTKRDIIYNCINGSELLKHLQRSHVAGSTGKLQFNSLGDSDPFYKIFQQSLGNTLQLVGSWTEEKHLVIDGTKFVSPDILLPHRRQCRMVCSRSQIQVPIGACCHTCKDCSNNEYPSSKKLKCLPCDMFMWPNNDADRCIPIIRTHIMWSSWIAICTLVLSTMGGIVDVCVMYGYVRHRSHHILKASSLENSFVSLGALLITYLSLPLNIGSINDTKCIVQNFCIHWSIGCVFTCIMVKTFRIYRIFSNSAKGGIHIAYTSTGFTRLLAGSVMAVDAFIIASLQFVNNDHIQIRMPYRDLEYVEEVCSRDTFRLWIPLGWNAMKLLICLYYGFKTRNLPANYHDSKCIVVFSMCSIFVWLTFYPAITASESLKTQLSLVLCAHFVNCTFVLCTLFIPKLYAIVILKQKVEPQAM